MRWLAAKGLHARFSSLSLRLSCSCPADICRARPAERSSSSRKLSQGSGFTGCRRHRSDFLSICRWRANYPAWLATRRRNTYLRPGMYLPLPAPLRTVAVPGPVGRCPCNGVDFALWKLPKKKDPGTAGRIPNGQRRLETGRWPGLFRSDLNCRNCVPLARRRSKVDGRTT